MKPFFTGLFGCFVLLGIVHWNAMAQTTALSESFTSCGSGLPLNWSKYSVAGSQTWGCAGDGLDDQGIYMNGYYNGNYYGNEDWLISPKVDVSSYYSPQLRFWSRTKYSGDAIQILLSTNYSGGNPNSANWTPLNLNLPTSNSDTWLASSIDIGPYKSQAFTLAVKYTSQTSAAASWKLDRIRIDDTLSKTFLPLGSCIVGSSTPAATFSFIKTGITGNLTLQVPSPFQLSKDGINFSNILIYSSLDENIQQEVYVRSSPLIPNKVFRSTVEFSYNGVVQASRVWLLANSIPDTKSISVASWNMRWFGYPSFCNCDTALAKNNAIRVMKDLQADLYCLQEVVNNQQIQHIQQALGSQYESVVSPFCSFASDTNDSQYDTGQKLAFIYNTQKIQKIAAKGLLNSTYPANNNPYYCFSSGRFPYLLEAKIATGGVLDTFIFCNIHGKADNTQTDYDRRECASQYMTDSLNTLYPGKKVLVIGDFNDYIQGSTVSGQSTSSYQYLLNYGFTGISLPSLYPNSTTYVGSESHLIDNIVVSNPGLGYYVDSSFFVFTEALNDIENYPTTTSDHYPVMSYWAFNYPTSVNYVTNAEPPIKVISPSAGNLDIRMTNTNTGNTWMDVSVRNFTGQLFYHERIRVQPRVNLSIPPLPNGLYWVEFKKNYQTTVCKWLVIH